MRPILLLAFIVFAYLGYLAFISKRDAPLKVLKGAGDSVTTIVLFRHGEKPSSGLGSLDCQGLNRAKVLSGVLESKFMNKPYYLIASNPAGKVFENGTSFNYIRPLITIAPMAIKNGLSVNTEINYDEVQKLHDKLMNPVYSNSTVFVAWEHKKLVEVARMLMSTYKNSEQIPDWIESDFDSLYVLKITRAGQAGKIEFSVEQEGLNGQSSEC